MSHQGQELPAKCKAGTSRILSFLTLCSFKTQRGSQTSRTQGQLLTSAFLPSEHTERVLSQGTRTHLLPCRLVRAQRFSRLSLRNLPQHP